MITDRPRCRTRDMCIICDSVPGSIRTSEGMVCEGCMPRELLPRASVLRRRDITVFIRSHPGAPSCLGDGDVGRTEGIYRPNDERLETMEGDGSVLPLPEDIHAALGTEGVLG